jgi:hypothetical protein
MQNNIKQTFEERKKTALSAAKELGIIGIIQESKDDGISLETLESAIRLVKEHRHDIFKQV